MSKLICLGKHQILACEQHIDLSFINTSFACNLLWDPETFVQFAHLADVAEQKYSVVDCIRKTES